MPLPVCAWAIRSLPGQRGGQAGGLDRRHAQVTQLLQVVQRGGVERQGVEGLGGGVCHGTIIVNAHVGTIGAVVDLNRRTPMLQKLTRRIGWPLLLTTLLSRLWQ